MSMPHLAPPTDLRWQQDPDLHAPIFDQGPGDDLDLLGMPRAERRNEPRMLVGEDHVADIARRTLEQLGAALQRQLAGERPGPIDLAGLADATRTLLSETLRTGEVTIDIAGPIRHEVVETALTGVWRVRAFREDGTVGADYLEVGPVPRVLEASERALTVADFALDAAEGAAGNGLPVLAEIRHWMAAWRPEQPNHVISLSLLPMSEDDLRQIGRVIGGGAVKAWSRGYGAVRATLTRARGVWQVEYLNVQDKVVVDTIEIGAVPAAVSAAREDFEDSLERLRAILDADRDVLRG